jgi:hypothetical protein
MTITLTIFLAVYVGMALGRFPGLQIDRTGIALISRRFASAYRPE